MQKCYDVVKKLINSHVELDEDKTDSVAKLVYLAYYFGREEATRQISNEYAEHIKKQKERARASRYYKMSLGIVGKEDYIYSSDYAQDMIVMFGGDPTTVLDAYFDAEK